VLPPLATDGRKVCLRACDPLIDIWPGLAALQDKSTVTSASRSVSETRNPAIR